MFSKVSCRLARFAVLHTSSAKIRIVKFRERQNLALFIIERDVMRRGRVNGASSSQSSGRILRHEIEPIFNALEEIEAGVAQLFL